MTNSALVRLALASGLMIAAATQATAQPGSAAGPTWTREQAMRELEMHPQDPFLQFVAMQLSTTPGDVAEVEPLLPTAANRRQLALQRRSSIDLYSIFSGSLAVQESLQLDAMTGEQDREPDGPLVTVESLRGPTVRSHPWEEMLGKKKPAVSRLAKCVPADHMFMRFRSVRSLFNTQDLFNEWYAYGLGRTQGQVRNLDVMDRLEEQWLLQIDERLMILYEATVDEAALTSSDLFFNEGTDATLILQLSRPGVIRPPLELATRQAAENNPRATITTGSMLGVDYTHVTTPDRSVHVYVADPTEELHVRSNSRVAFQRVLETILATPDGGDATESLGDSQEFRYIRTLMPEDSKQENVLLYLSDPFIRNLIGPEKKLTQRNRLVCRSRLRLLRHAQLLYRTQHGRAAESIEQLREGGCLGNSHLEVELTCPSGGSYSIERELTGARCSHHGSMENMVPCCEIPVERVSQDLAAEYRAFVEAYSRYWQTFFDPIAVRIRLQPQRTRVETLVLPLINNSIYTGIAAAVGDEPKRLDALPIPESNIATLAVNLDKKKLLNQIGIAEPESADSSPVAERERALKAKAQAATDSLAVLGLALHNHHSAYKTFPPRAQVVRQVSKGKALSWRVQILPFLGEQRLYERFRLDEPWDSPHNRALITEMPEIFSTGSPQTDQEGKTRFVMPRHPKAILQDAENMSRMRDIHDGVANTVMVIVADDPVVWTRPNDLDIDMDDPQRGWSEGVAGEIPLLMADASVVTLPEELSDTDVAKLLTRAGQNQVSVELPGRRSQHRIQPRSPRWLEQMVAELELAEFLHNGIGDQVAVHICDGQPLVDLNTSRLFGSLVGIRMGRGIFSVQPALMGLAAVAVNSPIYVAIPVKDGAAVDRTLERADRYLARIAREEPAGWARWMEVEQDAYQMTWRDDTSVSVYSFRIGPIKWRVYWTRIDDGLYIASKPEVIEQLQAAKKHDTKAGADDDGAAHAMIRLRPQHWDKVKSHYRIGWAESERQICLGNIPPLSHAARAVAAHLQLEKQSNTGDVAGDAATNASELPPRGVQLLAERLFGGPLRCPSDGTYKVSADSGTVSCTKHGAANRPEQPPADGSGRIAAFAEGLSDLRLELTFLDEGLRAVATIERE